MGCRCQKTAAFMASLGAKHAAKMHSALAGSGKGTGLWSRKDWLTHFDEEERYLVPLLRQYGFNKDADRIVHEHVMMRPNLIRYGVIDDRLLDAHSKLEDDAVEKLMARMGQ